MANKKSSARKPNRTYAPESYSKRTLHDEREYGFFWYEWLWKILRPVVIFLCSLLIVIGLVTFLWKEVKFRFLEPVEPGSNESVTFVIESGDSITKIGDNLVEQKLLKNAAVFRYLVQFKGLTNAISYGSYELTPGMNVSEIVTELTSGSQTNERTITVIPGWTVEDTADYLIAEGAITDRDEFLRLCNEPDRFVRYSYALSEAESAGRLTDRKYALEGYLAPDTYRVFRSADAESILKTLLSQGNNVVDNVFYADHTQYSVDAEGVYSEVEQYHTELNMDEIIVLASMIEKEAADANDYAKVSAVFYNRLHKGMRLESDAGINYIVGEKRLIMREEDLNADNGYNTYLRDGLPVGPICNPSQKAMLAALYPDLEYLEEEYLYFCAKTPESGELVFAKTAEEHQANVEMYRPSWEAFDAIHTK